MGRLIASLTPGKSIQAVVQNLRSLDGVALAAIVLLGALLRTWDLGAMGMYIDEAIWWNFAFQVERDDPLTYLNPVYLDGRPPLFMWLMLLAGWLGGDLLLASRSISVVAGLVAIVCIFWAGRALWSVGSGLSAAALYAVLPLAVFFDRIGSDDALAGAGAALALALSVWLARQPGLRRSLCLGLALGGAVLAKPLAAPILAGPLLAAWLAPHLKGTAWQRTVLAVLAVLLAIVSFAAVFVTVDRERLLEGLAQSRREAFLVSATELFALPWAVWLRHAGRELSGWMGYLAFPVWALLALGIAVGLARKDRGVVWVGAVWACFLAVDVLLLKIQLTRYLMVPLSAPVLLAGYGLAQVGNWIGSLAEQLSLRKTPAFWPSLAAAVLLAPTGVASVALVRDLRLVPSNVQIPPNDQEFYVQNWFSGYGLRELAEVVQAEASQNGKARFLGRWWPGLGMRVALSGTPGVEFIEEPATLLEASPGRVAFWAREGVPVYFATSESLRDENLAKLTRGYWERIPSELPEAVMIRELCRPGPECLSWLRLFKVPPGEAEFRAYSWRITEAPGESQHARVAVAGQTIGIAWVDRREHPSQRPQVYFRAIDMQSMRFQPERRLTSEGAEAPAMAANARSFGLVWEDPRHGKEELYFRTVDDQGIPAGPEARLTSAGEAEGRHSIQPALVWGQHGLEAVFSRHAGGANFELYYLAFDANGRTASAEVRLTDTPTASTRPWLASSPAGLGLVWQEGPAEDSKIWAALLDSRGRPWHVSELGPGRSPALGWHADHFLVSWVQEGGVGLGRLDVEGSFLPLGQLPGVAVSGEDSPAVAPLQHGYAAAWVLGKKMQYAEFSEALAMRRQLPLTNDQGIASDGRWPSLVALQDRAVAGWSDHSYGWTEVQLSVLPRLTEPS